VRELSDSELIELLPATTEASDVGASMFESISPANCRGESFLHRAVSTGLMQCEQANFNGNPAFLFWYHKSTDDGLWIDACQSYDMGVPIKVAFLAVEKLRLREKCSYIRFMSLRAGLIHESSKHGFKPEGIILVKL
jgi:hypothetical protein